MSASFRAQRAKSESLWVRGGFPDSFLTANDAASFQWQQAFVGATHRSVVYPGSATFALDARAPAIPLGALVPAQSIIEGATLVTDDATMKLFRAKCFL